MIRIDWRGAIVALAAGFGGAVAAFYLGLPAAALLGSTVAVTLAGFVRLGPTVPDLLRDIGFCVIGVSLGSGVTPGIWSDIARWPLSIAMLGLTVLVVMFACTLLLRLMFGADTATAMLATSPGALSYTLGLATERGADIRFVMVLQSLRLFLITIFMPPVVGFAESDALAGPVTAISHLTYGEAALM
ncbi:MAG: AbrB family transcriptional regulator, partial [Oricola sp.]